MWALAIFLTTAFVDVNVVPMDSERVLENQTVVIEGDRIAAIGSTADVAVPDGARVVDARGGYLVPGLADMHTHLSGPTLPFTGPEHLVLYLEQGVTTIRNLSATPTDLIWRDQINRDELIGPTIYSSGPTIVGLPAGMQQARRKIGMIVIAGSTALVALVWALVWLARRWTGRRERFRAGRRFALPSLAAVAIIAWLAVRFEVVPIKAHLTSAYPFAIFVDDEDAARRAVREQHAAGYDLIKVYDFLSEDAYLGAIDEARKQDMYVVGHLLDSLSVGEILSGGLHEIAHMDEFLDSHFKGKVDRNSFIEGVPMNYEQIPETVAVVRAHGVPIVSNLVADETVIRLLEDPEGLLSLPEYGAVDPDVLHAWRTTGRAVDWQGQQAWRRDTAQPFLSELTGALHAAGVRLTVGTDVSVEGMLPAHLHRELELLVDAGLSPYEALAAATRNAGEIIEVIAPGAGVGTIEVGKRADLMLLQGNPLDDIGNTRRRIGVMSRGVWRTSEELRGLVEVYRGTHQAHAAL